MEQNIKANMLGILEMQLVTLFMQLNILLLVKVEWLYLKNKKHSVIAKKIRNHGLMDRNNHDIVGYNYRMNELQARMGIIQLKKFEKLKKKEYLTQNI